MQKQIKFIYAVLIITIIGAGATLFILNKNRLDFQEGFIIKNPQTPEEIILGAWKQNTRFDGNVEIPIPDEKLQMQSPYGFVPSKNGYVYHNYSFYFNNKETFLLYDIDELTISKKDENKLLLSTSDNIYEIEIVSNNEIILSSFDKEDGDFNWKGRFNRIRSMEEEIAMFKPRTATETKNACDDILNGENDDFVFLPISCEVKIGKGDKAVFNFLESGELEITRGSDTLLSIGDEDENDLYLLDGRHTPVLRRNLLSLVDVTYDGYLDIELTTGCGAYQCYQKFIAYDPKTRRYNPNPILEGTTAEIDEKDRTINFYNKGRGLGDVYTYEEYQFNNGRYQLIERIDQDVVDWGDDSKGYVYKVEKLVDGKLIVVEENNLVTEDVLGDND